MGKQFTWLVIRSYGKKYTNASYGSLLYIKKCGGEMVCIANNSFQRTVSTIALGIRTASLPFWQSAFSPLEQYPNRQDSFTELPLSLLNPHPWWYPTLSTLWQLAACQMQNGTFDCYASG